MSDPSVKTRLPGGNLRAGSCASTSAGRVGGAGADRVCPPYALAATKESDWSTHLCLLLPPPVSSKARGI
eukprot:8303805-Pyramimonas_sp.AAC.1